MRLICAIALATAIVAPSARADAPCDKGYRDTTAAERATITKVLETARQALPPAPAGWVIQGDDQFSVTQSLCQDYEAVPWSYGFSRSYQRVDDYEARQALYRQAGENAQADLARKQPRLDALLAKQTALSQQQVALLEKGEYDKATALNEQMAALQAEYRQVMDEGDTAAENEALFAQAGKDQAMYVSVRVNPPAESAAAGARESRSPGGALRSFLWTRSDDGVEEGVALFLLGPWRPRAGGGWETAPRAGRSAPSPHTIAVSVTSDPARLAPTIEAIDFAALARVVTP